VWAGHSWSLVDVAGRLKPSWHAVRAACARRVLSIEPIGAFEQWKGGALEVVLSDFAWLADPASVPTASVSIERMGFDGTVHARAEAALVPFSDCGLPAATLRARVPESLLASADPARECLVARLMNAAELDGVSLDGMGGARACWFLAPDAELALAPARFDRIDATRCRARTLIRELWIECAAVASSSGWRTVLPGEQFELAEGDTWWCANSFGLGAVRSRTE
jgi:beta-mannosidase